MGGGMGGGGWGVLYDNLVSLKTRVELSSSGSIALIAVNRGERQKGAQLGGHVVFFVYQLEVVV